MSWWQNDPVAPPTAAAATNAANQTRSWLDTVRGDAQSARQVREMGDKFLGYNYGKGPFSPAATGGLISRLPFGLDNLVMAGSPNRQAMQGMTSSMMRAMMVPGQSRSMDSNKEMEFAIARLPNIGSTGAVNKDRVRDIQHAEFLAREKLKAAEEWARTRGDPDGFEQMWSAKVPEISAQFKYEPPPRRTPGKEPERSQQARRRYNPQTGKIE